MTQTTPPLNIVILGATGAVGTEVMKQLVQMPDVARITVLTRRPLTAVSHDKIAEHIVDVLDPTTYAHLLADHDTAICTLGVGAVSSVTKEEFLKIDRDAVIAFGTACKQANIKHFELLSSVGVDPKSRMFFLRSKGELEDALKALQFKRLSLFHPSNIITPTNRYGFGQAIVLKLWPKLNPILIGPLRKYRGIRVETLGQAFALNTQHKGQGIEILEWDAFQSLTART